MGYEGMWRWVFPKIGGNPKMDGENNGKPYFLMDDLGGKPTIFGNIHVEMLGDMILMGAQVFVKLPRDFRRIF